MKLVSQGKRYHRLVPKKYSEEELTNLGIRIHKSSDIERIEERTF